MNTIPYKKLFFLILAGYSYNHAMQEKDYYTILGVSSKTTTEELTIKFNQIYREYYPYLLRETKRVGNYQLEFREKVIAYMMLNNHSSEEPYHFYIDLNVPLWIPYNKVNPQVPPKEITPENVSEFFTKIQPGTVSNTYLNSRNPKSEKKEHNAFLILSDAALRRYYHEHPTQMEFDKALETYSPEKYEAIILKEEKEKKQESKKRAHRKSLPSIRYLLTLIQGKNTKL